MSKSVEEQIQKQKLENLEIEQFFWREKLYTAGIERDYWIEKLKAQRNKLREEK